MADMPGYRLGEEQVSSSLCPDEKHALKQQHSLRAAIFAYDDFLAGFIYAELMELGIHAGQDVLLLAPGDTLNYHLSFMPQISTMQIATAKLGEYGAGLIL